MKSRSIPVFMVPLLLSMSINSAPDLSAVEIEVTKLSDTVYLLIPQPPLAGNLAVSVGEDGILLVDDQMMPLAPKIKAAIARLHKGDITFLVNSHYHYDHAGGNAAFGDDSVIVAHRSVRKRLAEGREAGAQFIEGKRPVAALPVVSFDDNLTFHWNGEDVDVIHFSAPAHTDGDAIIFFRGSNVVHTGDQYVNLRGFPYIDHDVGGSALGLRDNMAKLLRMVDSETRIIPGHGPLASKADLAWYHDVVSRSIAFVEARARAGKSVEEIQKEGLPEEFKDIKGFMPGPAWIGFVYASLSL